MFNKLQVIATVLDIRAEQYECRPHWVQRAGPLVRILGPIINPNPKPGENIRAMTLQQAVWKAMEEGDLEAECRWSVLEHASPRASIYMELEAETMKQELTDGEKMCESIGGKDPRGVISLLMEHIKLSLAMQLTNPHEVVKGFFQLAVLSIAAYQWALKWFATLQTKPLDEPVRIFAFPTPPPADKIEVPEPLPKEAEAKSDEAQATKEMVDEAVREQQAEKAQEENT